MPAVKNVHLGRNIWGKLFLPVICWRQIYAQIARIDYRFGPDELAIVQ